MIFNELHLLEDTGISWELLGPRGASWGPLGVALGPAWVLFGACLGSPGTSCGLVGLPGASMGSLWGLPGFSLGPTWVFSGSFPFSLPRRSSRPQGSTQDSTPPYCACSVSALEQDFGGILFLSRLSQNGNVRYIMLDNTYNKTFPSKFRRVAKETPRYLKIQIEKATGI